MKISSTPRPNYQYWQENGDLWSDEYIRRRENQAFYSLQELMIASYFSNSAPAKILEYGCGPGRHLEYLRKIPGIDVYGYDQSKSMLRGISQWAEPDWSRTHVSLGAPVGTLPYADKAFDITFTAEVLIHVNPDDIPMILSELVRISRWHILHLEPSPDFIVAQDAHNGCWNHDLLNVYAQLGYKCQILPQGYQEQAPYRVILDDNRLVYQWPDISLALMLRAEKAWEKGRSYLTNKIEEINHENSDKISILEQDLQKESQLRAEESDKKKILEQQLLKEKEIRGEITNQLNIIRSAYSDLNQELDRNAQINQENSNKISILEQQLQEVNKLIPEYLEKMAILEQQLEKEKGIREEIANQLNIIQSENRKFKLELDRYAFFEAELFSLLGLNP